MKIKVFLNPYANRGRARESAPQVREALTGAGLDFELALTLPAEEGTKEIWAAAQGGYDAIVAAGGDGTVNLVVNGLIQAAGDGPSLPLGILPLGTANDFSNANGLPRDLAEAARVIASGKVRPVDAGRVNGFRFANNCAMAMEALVTLTRTKSRLAGNRGYLLALLRSLAKLRAWQMRVSWEDGAYEGPVMLLSVCNGPRSGGLFRMAPQAKPDDGWLDLVLLPKVSKLEALTLLPCLFTGRHLQHPKAVARRVQRVLIESKPGTPLHADGEVLAEAAVSAVCTVLPGRISLLV
jgi:diacylglycerol kinase (ATP)